VPITLKDIAEELNVSVNTVSRALRDMPDIGQETTNLVKETALRLGYRKNLAASSLKTAKSMMLGIVVPDICNPVFSYMYRGIEKICNETGYTLMLGNSNTDPDKECKVLDNMLDHGVDGIFLVPSMKDDRVLERLKNADIPYVILQRRFHGIDAHVVQSSDHEGGYMAAQHLYDLGHRSFLYISAPMYISSAKERYEGFLTYLKEKGLSEADVQIMECSSSRNGGYQAAKKWLQQQKLTSEEKMPEKDKLSATAIFCFSDYMAYGVYAAIAESDLQVSEDVSIVGYDNNEYSEMIYPPLTTVDMFPEQVGSKAAELMFGLLKDKEKREEIVESVISPKLILRESTRKYGR